MPGDLAAKRAQDEVQNGSIQQDGPPALFEDFVSVPVPDSFVLMASREAMEPLPPQFLMTGAWVGKGAGGSIQWDSRDPKCSPLDHAPHGQEGSPSCSLLHPPSLQESPMPTVCRREGGKEEEGRKKGGRREVTVFARLN